MEYVIYILYALVIFLVVKRFMSVKGIKNISTAELKTELQDKNKQFVDVRTPVEFQRNKIKEFKNIPLHTIAKSATDQLARDKEVVVICQSGMRSQKAAKVLKKLGFTNVTNVKGGMSAWVKHDTKIKK
ncbi:rhodanese-like domain protein [Gracilibacillus boraciitolerans JCM 21714]|uniref:Rhodanese-like domain protein n=1 Tax=Gracilibacillus boraciitolerans JCM 21714 TaxID=1298598 RepID=W4VQ40_9BACI|nr:rhodanese-like domain-containing protein [Gracilibacillus boraciitolerans]GAE95301.1 rhodanese-like domain protein [Gracilibacillus boraciitolerans JCM 21714]